MDRINSLVPELWCSDFDASLRFYVDVCGFSVGQRRGEDKHAYLTLGESQLMIGNWDQDGTWESGPFEQPYGRGINLQILVEDFRALWEQVREAAAEVFVELYTTQYCSWQEKRGDARSTRRGPRPSIPNLYTGSFSVLRDRFLGNLR